MTQPFKNLDPSKQKRIINAALKEFTEKGYDQASTNQIVKNAGIGKGMLFYYFQNKKALYHYLIRYSLDIIINDYLSQIDTKETDFIERLKQATQIKMTAFAAYPDVFYFMGTLFLTHELDLPDDLNRKYEELQRQGYVLLYENIDDTLYRPDFDAEKVFQIIRWFMEGYENDLKRRLKDQKLSSIHFDPYVDEFFQYLDILKKSFYKQEEDAK